MKPVSYRVRMDFEVKAYWTASHKQKDLVDTAWGQVKHQPFRLIRCIRGMLGDPRPPR